MTTALVRVPDGACVGLAATDVAALRQAARLLEANNLLGRIAAATGVAMDRLAHMLPAAAQDVVAEAAERALATAMRGACQGVIARSAAPGPRAWLSRRLTSRWFDRAAVSLSGIAGGAAGLAGTIAELPVTTTMILRAIAQIAALEGEDVTTEAGRLECLSVFAFGSPRPGGEAAEGGYYAVRMGLAELFGQGAGRSLNTMLPAILRPIVARFGMPVGWKFAGQAVPLAGAAAGALINIAFIDHFQDKARGHFTVRRLERRYGAATVRACYDSLRPA
jgi:hypothetical protein